MSSGAISPLSHNTFNIYFQLKESNFMFICEIGCLIGISLNSANLICRSTDISKCFRGSLRLWDNRSRLYFNITLYFDIITGSRNAYEIFKYARNAIDPKVEFTRFDVPRAGLKLFAKHASQFNLYLIDDYQVNTFRDLFCTFSTFQHWEWEWEINVGKALRHKRNTLVLCN